MPGPYLIGVDCGTQSAKVVIYDVAGRVVSEGRQQLRPMSRPQHGVAFHPDDDLWDSIASASRRAMAGFTGAADEIVGVGLCTIRCCKAFLAADGSLVEPVISWMDDRAYQPYLPDDPALAYATTSSGYLGHRFTGELRDTAANNIVLQWPIDTDTWEWSDDDALFEDGPKFAQAGRVRARRMDGFLHRRTHGCGQSAAPGAGTMPSSWMSVGASSANTGAAAVPPKRSSVPAGGSSTETSTVTCGFSAGKNPTKLE